MAALDKITDKITNPYDTKAERRTLLSRYGFWAGFVILLSLVPLAWAPELTHTYGFFTITKILGPIVALGGIFFITAKNDPNYDKYQIWIVIAVAVLVAFTAGFAATYRATPEKSRWDYKAPVTDTIK